MTFTCYMFSVVLCSSILPLTVAELHQRNMYGLRNAPLVCLKYGMGVYLLVHCPRRVASHLTALYGKPSNNRFLHSGD